MSSQALKVLRRVIFEAQRRQTLHQMAGIQVHGNILAQKVRNDGLWGSVGLDHLLVMATALDGRPGADVSAEHSIQMIFSLPNNIAVDEGQESFQKFHILSIFFLGPVQRIIFFYLLGVILKPVFAFTRFEEPWLDLLKRTGILALPSETGRQSLRGSLGEDLVKLTHGGPLLYYLIKLSRHNDNTPFNYTLPTKSIVLQFIPVGQQRLPSHAPKLPFLMKSRVSCWEVRVWVDDDKSI